MSDLKGKLKDVMNKFYSIQILNSTFGSNATQKSTLDAFRKTNGGNQRKDFSNLDLSIDNFRRAKSNLNFKN